MRWLVWPRHRPLIIVTSQADAKPGAIGPRCERRCKCGALLAGIYLIQLSAIAPRPDWALIATTATAPISFRAGLTLVLALQTGPIAEGAWSAWRLRRATSSAVGGSPTKDWIHTACGAIGSGRTRTAAVGIVLVVHTQRVADEPWGAREWEVVIECTCKQFGQCGINWTPIAIVALKLVAVDCIAQPVALRSRKHI